jgi:hypothetical protein
MNGVERMLQNWITTGPRLRRALLLALIVACSLQAQNDKLTNTRIVELASQKLSDDIIVAKIKSGTCSFQLDDSDLVDLKKSGVSPRVIAAMIEVSEIKLARVTLNGKPLELHSVYTLTGKHAAVAAGSSPEIIVELPKDDAIEHFVLVQLDEVKDHRELDLAFMRSEKDNSGGIWYRKKSKESSDVLWRMGVRLNALQSTSAAQLGENKFRLQVDSPLKAGEYFILILEPHERSEQSIDFTSGQYARGFDFTVQ